MVNTCLNCGKEVPNGVEICDYCLENLDEMIDSNEIGTRNEVDIEGNTNPFFSTARPTGSIQSPSKDSIGSIAEQDEGPGSFFMGLGIILVLMAIMIAIFLN